MTVSAPVVAAIPRTASLAIVVMCLTLLLSNMCSYLAGRAVEQRSELGKVLTYAPALEDMTAATRFADSAGMQFLLGCRARVKLQAR